jgi:hypothetical protein
MWFARRRLAGWAESIYDLLQVRGCLILQAWAVCPCCPSRRVRCMPQLASHVNPPFSLSFLECFSCCRLQERYKAGVPEDDNSLAACLMRITDKHGGKVRAACGAVVLSWPGDFEAGRHLERPCCRFYCCCRSPSGERWWQKSVTP